MKEPVFTGVATAIVTPFVKDEIDFEGYDLILARHFGRARLPRYDPDRHAEGLRARNL